MKYVIVSIFLTASVFGAPTTDLEKEDDFLRTKKSPSGPYYGGQVPPCAGRPLGPVSLYLAPESSGYGNPVAHGLPSAGYSPPIPHYRNDETQENNKDVSLKEEHSGRSNYLAAATSSYALSGDYGGPAVGLFPNARVGGCAVPLLLSCSPSVVQGQLSYSGYGGANYPAYKATETEELHRDLRGVAHEDWSEEENSKNHKTTHGEPHHHHIVFDDHPHKPIQMEQKSFV